jgi:hypothetical protein
MKLAYFLQTIKGVPLGYTFRLYLYGPFDSDVLNDLGHAQVMEAVESKIVPYASGYGYVFSPGPNRALLRGIIGSELAKYHDSITWVLSEFGTRSAADLELLSTIVYADRDAYERHRRIAPDDLCRQVLQIKPLFSEQHINNQIQRLDDKKLLLGLDRNPVLSQFP